MKHRTTATVSATTTATAATSSGIPSGTATKPALAVGPAMTTTPIPALTEGLDLGDRHSVACFMAADRTILSRPTVATTPEALRDHFQTGPLRRVVIEASTPANWVYRLAQSLGHEAIMAQPRQVRLIANNQFKNDHNDAELLAEIGRSNPALLAPVQPRGEQQQADFAVVHARERLVDIRTQTVNFLRSQVKLLGARLPDCGAEACHNKIAVEQLPELLRPALLPLLDLLKTVSHSIANYDRLIETTATARYAPCAKLMQIDGVGRLTALTFMLSIGDPQRFDISRDVGPFFGLVIRQKQSSQSDPHLSITKQGSRYMRSLLVTAAHYIMGVYGPDCLLRRAGMRIYEKGGQTRQAKRKAIIAVARKLAVLMHRLWMTGADYDPWYGLPPEAASQARSAATTTRNERIAKRKKKAAATKAKPSAKGKARTAAKAQA